MDWARRDAWSRQWVGYLRDMLGLLEKHRVHNTYWQWRYVEPTPLRCCRRTRTRAHSFDLDTLTLFVDVLPLAMRRPQRSSRP